MNYVCGSNSFFPTYKSVDCPELYAISYWLSIQCVVTEPLSLTVFEIFCSKHPCARAHTDTQAHAASDFIFCPMQCIALD